MGFSFKEIAYPQMCFNGQKSDQLGWYKSKTKILSESALPWTGILSPFTDYGRDDVNTVLLQLGESTYINFNVQTKFNSQTQEFADRVVATIATGTGGYSSSVVGFLPDNDGNTIQSFENGQYEVEVCKTKIREMEDNTFEHFAKLSIRSPGSASTCDMVLPEEYSVRSRQKLYKLGDEIEIDYQNDAVASNNDFLGIYEGCTLSSAALLMYHWTGGNSNLAAESNGADAVTLGDFRRFSNNAVWPLGPGVYTTTFHTNGGINQIRASSLFYVSNEDKYSVTTDKDVYLVGEQIKVSYRPIPGRGVTVAGNDFIGIFRGCQTTFTTMAMYRFSCGGGSRNDYCFLGEADLPVAEDTFQGYGNAWPLPAGRYTVSYHTGGSLSRIQGVRVIEIVPDVVEPTAEGCGDDVDFFYNSIQISDCDAFLDLLGPEKFGEKCTIYKSEAQEFCPDSCGLCEDSVIDPDIPIPPALMMSVAAGEEEDIRLPSEMLDEDLETQVVEDEYTVRRLHQLR
uniref:ShKT domain-containing protein n=1 Tax=Grammatophora oceanica TaxID=210454 RepID=A0A7S1YKB2_9STRA|mmetsp:Transcript_7499/g.10997  ORF Transcript_7499/g.10997 Transcript_7499/m.10997 type:complete len:510 (+) Transcript_7499:1-1530(+)